MNNNVDNYDSFVKKYNTPVFDMFSRPDISEIDVIFDNDKSEDLFGLSDKLFQLNPGPNQPYFSSYFPNIPKINHPPGLMVPTFSEPYNNNQHKIYVKLSDIAKVSQIMAQVKIEGAIIEFKDSDEMTRFSNECQRMSNQSKIINFEDLKNSTKVVVDNNPVPISPKKTLSSNMDIGSFKKSPEDKDKVIQLQVRQKPPNLISLAFEEIQVSQEDLNIIQFKNKKLKTILDENNCFLETQNDKNSKFKKKPDPAWKKKSLIINGLSDNCIQIVKEHLKKIRLVIVFNNKLSILKLLWDQYEFRINYMKDTFYIKILDYIGKQCYNDEILFDEFEQNEKRFYYFYIEGFNAEHIEKYILNQLENLFTMVISKYAINEDNLQLKAQKLVSDTQKVAYASEGIFVHGKFKELQNVLSFVIIGEKLKFEDFYASFMEEFKDIWMKGEAQVLLYFHNNGKPLNIENISMLKIVEINHNNTQFSLLTFKGLSKLVFEKILSFSESFKYVSKKIEKKPIEKELIVISDSDEEKEVDLQEKIKSPQKEQIKCNIKPEKVEKKPVSHTKTGNFSNIKDIKDLKQLNHNEAEYKAIIDHFHTHMKDFSTIKIFLIDNFELSQLYLVAQKDILVDEIKQSRRYFSSPKDPIKLINDCEYFEGINEPIYLTANSSESHLNAYEQTSSGIIQYYAMFQCIALENNCKKSSTIKNLKNKGSLKSVRDCLIMEKSNSVLPIYLILYSRFLF